MSTSVRNAHPLPTEQGTRFRGALTGCAPIWWFTTRGRNDDASPLVTVWIGEDGTEVHEDDVKDVGLTLCPVLTRADLGALPIGAVVDATVTGVRVRAMHLETGGWSLTERLDNSPFATTLEIKDAVLVTAAPILPAPAPALPTEPGIAVSAIVTRDGASRRCVLVRTQVDDAPCWHSGAPVGDHTFHRDEHLSDWREVAP